VAFRALVVTLFLIGLAVRVAPLLEGGDVAIPEGRLLSQWPTEDGYFMLAMGRNVALGHGLSVSGGEMPTNGTQPLTTFVWALGFSLVGGDRLLGVLLAQVLQILAALGTAWLMVKLAERALGEREGARETGLLAAGFWFASPVAIPHTMNCLETGFYALLAVGVAVAFLARPRAELWSWRRTLGFGVLLGACFWVRNDGAFLIAAACLTYLAPALDDRASFRPRLARVLAFGATSVLVASPWLIFNVVEFGHLMPVSGRAEALTGEFGGNLVGIPIVLAEYLMTVLPIPHALSGAWWMIAMATLVVVLAVGVLIARREHWTPREKQLLLLVGLYVLALVAFYGLYFGAAWFLPRYFLPASPFLALFFAVGVRWAHGFVQERGALGHLVPVAAAAAVAVMGFLHLRQYRNGADHMHFQVVRWVNENVPAETWVGAIQTGTLGFFHDRTINLDGKVNIAAYEALLADRQAVYVADETPIVYLADWVGMRDWLTMPLIAERFELIVEDEDANLGVLRRRGPPPRSGLR
tara:strand:- start:2030 stop:3607 length:1578 start_codon:yes stop_codon:yes gene_type:complete